jgi:hypothetical protein
MAGLIKETLSNTAELVRAPAFKREDCMDFNTGKI